MADKWSVCRAAEAAGNWALAEAGYFELCGMEPNSWWPWLFLARARLFSGLPGKLEEAELLLSTVKDFGSFEVERPAGCTFFLLRARAQLMRNLVMGARSDVMSAEAYGLADDWALQEHEALVAWIFQLQMLLQSPPHMNPAQASASSQPTFVQQQIQQPGAHAGSSHAPSQPVWGQVHPTAGQVQAYPADALTGQPPTQPPEMGHQAPLDPEPQPAPSQAGQLHNTAVKTITRAACSLQLEDEPSEGLDEALSKTSLQRMKLVLDYLKIQDPELSAVIDAHPNLKPISCIFAGFARKPKEETHVEYKKSFNNWKREMPKQVTSLYNGLSVMRYPALTVEQCGASYLLYGLNENKHCHRFAPLKPVDGNVIQEIIRDNTSPSLAVHLFRANFLEAVEIGGGHEAIQPGEYGLLEVRTSTLGPARYLHKEKGVDRWRYACRQDDCTYDYQAIYDSPVLSRDLFLLFPRQHSLDSLDAVEQHLRRKHERLKILAIDQTLQTQDKELLESLYDYLGRGHFQLILNFDPTKLEDNAPLQALARGIEAKGVAKKFLDWSKIEELKDNSVSVLQDIWYSRKTYIVQMTASRIPDNLLTKQFGSFADKIFSQKAERLRTPLFLACLASPAHDRLVLGLMEKIEESFECEVPQPEPWDVEAAPSDSETATSILLTAEHSEVFQKKYRKAQDDEGKREEGRATPGRRRREWFQSFSPLDQLSTLFKNLYAGGAELGKVYRLPGVSGAAEVPVRKWAPFEADVRLLHEDAGRMDYELHSINEDQLERYRQAQRRRFAQGQELTVQGLYVHEQLLLLGQLGVYIERSIFSGLTQDLRKAIEKVRQSGYGQPQADRKDKTRCFRHEPSSGGSTSALVSVWALKKEYPCLVVLSELNDTVAEAVRFVEQATKKTQVLLVDQSRVSEADALGFHHRAGVPLVILHVTSVSTTKQGPDLCLAMSKIENKAWYNFYQDYIEDAKKAELLDTFQINYLKDDKALKAPYLFGLMTFMESFQGFRSKAEHMLKLSQAGPPRDILLLAAYLRQNAGKKHLSSNVVNAHLGLIMSQEEDGKILDKLGLLSFLLISTKKWGEAQDWGLTVPTLPLADLLLEVFPTLPGEGPHVVITVIDLVVRIVHQDFYMKGPMQRYVMTLFLYKKMVSESDGSVRQLRHCELVRQVFRDLDPTEAAAKLQSLASSVGGETGAHVYAHTARYLAYNFPELHFPLAIHFVNLSLDLESEPGAEDPLTPDYSSTLVENHRILCIAAHILFCYIDQKVDSLDKQIAHLGSVTGLCRRAQDCLGGSHRACHPFITEIQYLHMVQMNFFGGVCGSSEEAYFASLGVEAAKTEAGERHERLLAAILHVEDLHQAGQLQGAELREKEIRTLEGIKTWIRGLYLSQGSAFESSVYREKIRHPQVLAWLIIELFYQQANRDASHSKHFLGRKYSGEFDIETKADVSELERGDRLSFWHTARFIGTLGAEKVQQGLRVFELANAHLQRRNLFERVCLLMTQQRESCDHVKRYQEALREAEVWAAEKEWDVLPAFLANSLSLALCLHLQLRITKGQNAETLRRQKQELRSFQSKYRSSEGQMGERLAADGRVSGPNAPRFSLQRQVLRDGRELVRLYPVAPTDLVGSKSRLAHELLFQGRCTGQPYRLSCALLWDATGKTKTVNAPGLDSQADLGDLSPKDFGLCLSYAGPVAVNIRDPESASASTSQE